jgi:copper chaperone CopZ
MTCSHCKASVKSAVYSFSGVESASVDLLTGQVIVLGSGLDESAIKDKIKGKGFSLK